MNHNRWSYMFLAAAAFNFLMGAPIFFVPAWSYGIAYIGDPIESTLRFWSDFGFAVIIIGIGYWFVSRDVTRNRGIVWLGIFAKLFDVVVLSYRYWIGVANPVVLFPAAIDFGFVILFVLFLRNKFERSRAQ
jgi:hypothetical protein